LGPLYQLCAQEVDAYIGLGTAWDSSNGNQIDTFGDQTLHAAPWLAGVFPHFGVNVLFNKQFGVGWTAAWRWASADYAGLQYHSTFHTFDAVFRPVKISTSRFVPEFRAGEGGRLFTSISTTQAPAIRSQDARLRDISSATVALPCVCMYRTTSSTYRGRTVREDLLPAQQQLGAQVFDEPRLQLWQGIIRVQASANSIPGRS
jgi:hypothetical protein